MYTCIYDVDTTKNVLSNGKTRIFLYLSSHLNNKISTWTHTEHGDRGSVTILGKLVVVFRHFFPLSAQ